MATNSLTLFDPRNKNVRNDKGFQSEPVLLTVTTMIMELGIPASIKGYFYLREAIIYKIGDFDVCTSLTKVLYPFIAEQYNTTSIQVERSIRHAVEVAWRRGDLAVRQKFFGDTISRMAWKPSNGEFIATLVDYVKVRAQVL